MKKKILSLITAVMIAFTGIMPAAMVAAPAVTMASTQATIGTIGGSCSPGIAATKNGYKVTTVNTINLTGLTKGKAYTAQVWIKDSAGNSLATKKVKFTASGKKATEKLTVAFTGSKTANYKVIMKVTSANYVGTVQGTLKVKVAKTKISVAATGMTATLMPR